MLSRLRQNVPTLILLLLFITEFANFHLQTQTAVADGFVDTAFKMVWERTDQPVANSNVTRTWVWGPNPGTSLYENYGDNGGKRLVQYFDKSRMEINNPRADRNSDWFVTNGLLARELISGNIQTGDTTFEKREPAQIPVAGDQDDPNSPTYADLTSVSTLTLNLNAAPSEVGTVINTTLSRGKTPGTTDLGQIYGVNYTSFQSQTNHNIAGPFWDYLNATGPVLQENRITTDKLFTSTFFATGLPISEAYWVRAKVGGVEKDVLIQAFERRVLTYTPTNEPQWRVEMGNIGQHYYHWRYEENKENPQPTPDPVYDNRFGMAVTGNFSAASALSAPTLDGYARTLEAYPSWYDYANVKVSGETAKSRVQLVYIRQNWTFNPGSYERKLLDSQVAASTPGSYWLMGSEPNVDGIEQTTPARYVQEYETVKNLVRAKDPDAKLVGPNVLNWNYTCDGCPGFTQADGWTSQMLAEYKKQFGHDIDFDAWGIHTYGLNWNKLPLTNYQQDIEQVKSFREFLDSQPGQAGKPIWITEFGVIWGYDSINWQQDSKGNWMALPGGTYQKQALLDYLNNYTDWLVNQGPDYKVEKWFLYSSAGFPEPYSTTFSGINLFDGIKPDSKLTEFGELYKAKAFQAGSVLTAHSK